MKFQFHVELTPEIVARFNTFVMTKTNYGKRQIRGFNIGFSVFAVILILIFLIRNGFSSMTLAMSLPIVIVWAGFIIGFPTLLKASLNGMVKKSNAGYDPQADVVFYDDVLEEITDDKTTKQTYKAVHRVTDDGGLAIYLFIDDIRAYILPRSSFESDEQYAAFLTFINEKIS